MPTNVRVVKGKLVVEDEFSELERRVLAGRHRSRTELELRRTRHESLAFLADLPALERLEVVSAEVDDPTALAEAGALRTLFLNGTAPRSGWGFLADLTQIEELHLLNVRGPLALPDLCRLDRLRTFRAWGCTGLADVSSLESASRLEEVELVATSVTADGLLPLLAKPSVLYVSATFTTKRENERFRQHLDRYGKRAFREPA